MQKTNKRWFVLTILLVLFPFTLVNATEVQQVETTGSIGFTGVYEPIGTPDPTPPGSGELPPITDVAKPGGSLPQTNDLSASWLSWVGVFLLSLVFLIWKREKNQQKKYNQQKAGIIT